MGHHLCCHWCGDPLNYIPSMCGVRSTNEAVYLVTYRLLKRGMSLYADLPVCMAAACHQVVYYVCMFGIPSGIHSASSSLDRPHILWQAQIPNCRLGGARGDGQFGGLEVGGKHTPLKANLLELPRIPSPSANYTGHKSEPLR
jgi:hypothetical protein